MITSIFDFIQRFFQFFIWWCIIQPWEQAVRVRLGKNRTRLTPGLHWKFPIIDMIYKQTTRRRYTQFGPCTVTTRDGATITLSGNVGYTIIDLDKLYDTLHHAEDAVHSICSGTVTEYIAVHTLDECAPERVTSECEHLLDLERFGLRTDEFKLSGYARVRTYRLLMEQQNSFMGDTLSTTRNTEA